MSALTEDYTQAALDEADLAMLTYTEKLTRTPGSMTQGDVDLLTEVGFSKSAVLDICQATAYYAFVNRLADGLGVELEGEHE